ncbi:MAG: nucleotidyltransferase domain-containing protein, partial [Planctomycetota bacterium]
MKKSLDHLPKQKQDELEIIRDIILEKVPDVRMIVLFGSYARGQAVEDI